MPLIIRLFALLVFMALPLAALAQSTPFERDNPVAEAIKAKSQPYEGRYTIIWVENDTLSDEEIRVFARQVDEGARAIREHLGTYVDQQGGNDRKLEIFLSTDAPGPRVTAAHEPWIFIPVTMVPIEMAPYLHEMVHVLAQWSWRQSEWAAEGFANHVAAAVRPTIEGYHRSFILRNGLGDLHEHLCSEVAPVVMPLVGTNGRRRTYAPADEERFQLTMRERMKHAPPFYSFAWSFTDYIVGQHGIEGFHRVATAPDQDAAVRELTGVSMADYRQQWWTQATAGLDCASEQVPGTGPG